ncbi:MAG: hypothetical protein GY953_01760, partial [bacterium]|nr:hypothetical protein [bacterium]
GLDVSAASVMPDDFGDMMLAGRSQTWMGPMDFSVDFESFAEIGKPVFVNSKVRDKEMRRGALNGMLYAGNFVQNEKPIGFMSGRWHMYSKKVMERMRRSALKGGG